MMDNGPATVHALHRDVKRIALHRTVDFFEEVNPFADDLAIAAELFATARSHKGYDLTAYQQETLEPKPLEQP